MQFKLKKIRSDASFREFFRLHKGNKTSIIVTAKKERFKNLVLYSAINRFLRKKGIYTPKLISHHFKEGIMEIEDFGNNTLLHHIKLSKNKLRLYKNCVDLILKFQKIKQTRKIKLSSNKYFNLSHYNMANIHKESNLFFNWYLPGVLGKKKTLKFKKIIKKELNKLYKKIFFKNQFIVHRDFHVSNVMYHKKKFYLIDSQDAVYGNIAYDLASLIDDVRLKTSQELKNKIFKLYIRVNKSIDQTKLKNDFEILSVLRNLKIIGIFTRLAVRDSKKKYMKMIPYAWQIIEQRMSKNVLFEDLEFSLNKYFSKKLRLKKWK